ncbi:D-alanyl-D-alanine carboxypeptidase family protein [Marinimicrobium alkaliphilum]|uniref:D-alanyl-D-alanine carboxypeptidase family protein n=1 Tax=Marinimicrobium alkaliphilum TaxID=2202654 RepID=UPI000DB9CAD0|nr:D-alanyl-D-alanine carboxypeptidase family protein [Marinimicrobium alkaliphilum]
MLKQLMIALGLAACASLAHAQQVLIPAPPQVNASGYILMDADTGRVLIERNADELLPPASLSKIMTVYIVASEIDQGRLNKSDLVRISPNAWRKGGAASGGSTMFLDPNSEVPVIDLLRGVIVQSGNDASIALAEHIAGSEDAFADVMNQKAALMGMNASSFENATGLPGANHLTTARDMAVLARAMIREYPDIYRIYSERAYTYNGIRQPNRNALLFRDDSVDGMKTGHTREAGYCLVASAQRQDMRLISVVMGTSSAEARAVETQKLLAYGFRYYETKGFYDAGDTLTTRRVWSGRANEIDLTVAEDIRLTIPRGSERDLKATMTFEDVIRAPIEAGQRLGTLTVELHDEMLAEVPLIALQDVERAGFFARIVDSIKLFFRRLFS